MSERRHSLTFVLGTGVVASALGARNLQDAIDQRNKEGYRVRALTTPENDGTHLVTCR